jgi:hypothetical protein
MPSGSTTTTAGSGDGALWHEEESLRAIRRSGQKSKRNIPRRISRFLSGERDMRMATADKLARVLSLKLTSELGWAADLQAPRASHLLSVREEGR